MVLKSLKLVVDKIWRKTELDKPVKSMIEMEMEKTAWQTEENGKCKRHGLQDKRRLPAGGGEENSGLSSVPWP